MNRVLRVLRDGVIGLSALFLVLLIVAKLDRDNRVRLDGRFVAADGDTLTQGDRRLRLEGIDAPELEQTCDVSGTAVTCGGLARQRLAEWTAVRGFFCSGGNLDRYGRLLVRCLAGAVDVNGAMVREGLAVAYGDYLSEEGEARRAGIGLWGGDFIRPSDWRRVHHAGMEDMPHDDGFFALLLRRLGVN